MMKDRNQNETPRLRSSSYSYSERIIHDEEFGEDNVELIDEEWSDFERVLREFRERKLLNSAKENAVKVKKGRRLRQHAFYPCPPPNMGEGDQISIASSDETDDNETLVRLFCFVLHAMYIGIYILDLSMKNTPC